MDTSASDSEPQAIRRLTLAAAALFVGLSTWHAWDISAPGLVDRSGRLEAPDFAQFYTYAALAREDAWDRLYDAAAHEDQARRAFDGLTLDSLRPNYPPLIAWLLQPLAATSYQSALAWFSLVTVILYGAAVGLLQRRTARLGAHLPVVALVAVAFPAVFVVLRYGQLSGLSLLLLSAATALAASGKGLGAGVALGLLAYKPNLLVVPILAMALARSPGLLMGVGLGAGAELAVNAALAGSEPVRQYVQILATLARQPELVQFYPTESHSLRGFARLLVGEGLVVSIVGLLAPLAMSGAVWRVWHSQADWRPRWAALVLGSLLGSPHLITYDLLLLAVPLVLVADWRLAGGSRLEGPWAWALAGCYVAAWPGPFIARLYRVQVSTIAMAMLLWLLARPRPAGRS